jgi:UDP-N-acetylglucosamine--N-acetylmuramyl-(pentapeptide) pyrophosphoryl-undecaprenol N-acetylglucosamine transferase
VSRIKKASRKTTGIRLAIAGGGTGGHLYPGIAIARELQRRDPHAEILFIGTRHGLESRLIPREGFPLKTIAASGLKGMRGLAMIKGIGSIPLGLLDSWRILRAFDPEVIAGVGGYASGPPLLMAALMGIPAILQEQNAYPGMTNRLLQHFVSKVATAFPECERFFGQKAILTGNPVRSEFMGQSSERRPGPFTVLVFGGSQGARAINQAVQGSLRTLRESADSFFFIHQTGQNELAAVSESYRQAGVQADVRSFFEDMPSQFEKADLLLCRAGATTLAELTVAGKASILVPFPLAADNHQERNAEALRDAGAAEIILQPELTPERLAQRFLYYCEHREKLAAMEEKSRKLGRPDAARQIVNLIEEMIHV